MENKKALRFAAAGAVGLVALAAAALALAPKRRRLASMDLDGGGRIVNALIQQSARRRFAEMDANGDGPLTGEELPRDAMGAVMAAMVRIMTATTGTSCRAKRRRRYPTAPRSGSGPAPHRPQTLSRRNRSGADSPAPIWTATARSIYVSSTSVTRPVPAAPTITATG